MKLATLKSKDIQNRDGELVVVSANNLSAVRPNPNDCLTMKQALENWEEISPQLESLYRQLNEGQASGAFELDLTECLAPLPHAPGFYDGSAFLTHVQRARKARGDTMPESAKQTPLMYQGVSDNLLSYNASIEMMDESYGADFEGEFAVVTTDVPKATTPEQADKYMVLFSLFNDITYREVLKTEIKTKFGFLQSKPNSAFAPFLVTPDELGEAWKEGRIHAEITVKLNDELFGHPHGKEMHFSFHQLLAHACRTRPLSAGTIIGTGTVSNEDKAMGFACLTEKRFQETIDTGSCTTRWLDAQDRVSMDVILNGSSMFGPIEQVVKR